MKVAFVNENTLGHASYLVPFVRELRKQPELGVVPYVIDATPLPKPFATYANFSIKGVRRWGLDFHNARWRMTASYFVKTRLRRLMNDHGIHAVVVNTQSVALALMDLCPEVPIFVCLDATFHQLSSWFAPNAASRFFLHLTAGNILKRERRLFHSAERLLAWSNTARTSLIQQYGCIPDKINLLPPSIRAHRPADRRQNSRRQILFIGGDFHRKGGAELLECYRRRFATTCDLHLVTHSRVDPSPGVFVHHGVQSYSRLWYERWQQADVFVFPSTLETFGIVLLEALALGVPVISADVGAARWILSDGKAGLLIGDRSPDTLAAAIQEVFDDSESTRSRVQEGLRQIDRHFDLSRNTCKLATWLQRAVAGPQVASLMLT